MARATVWMAIFNIIAAGIAIAQWWNLSGQLSAMKEQINVAARVSAPLLNIAEIQLFEASQPTIRITQTNSLGAAVLGLTVRNDGKTNTTIRKISFDYFIGKALPNPQSPKLRYSLDYNFVLQDYTAPQSERASFQTMRETPFAISSHERDDIANNFAKLWVYGVICYRNIFNKLAGHRFVYEWVGRDNKDFAIVWPTEDERDREEDCQQ